MADRLYKSRTDRVISGVAGGVAEQLNLDPSIVRVAWVVLAIMSGGVIALIYLVMMIVVPEPPPESRAGDPFVGTADPAHPGEPITASEAAPRPATTDPGGALLLGVILILVGGFFLLRQYAPQVDVGAAWPVLALAAGVVLVVLSLLPRGRGG